MTPLLHWQHRLGEEWLIGLDSYRFDQVVHQRMEEVKHSHLPAAQENNRPLKILLAEPDPLTFLASFLAACGTNCHVFLANPDWADAEWQQVLHLVQPDVVWGSEEKKGTSHTRNQRTDVTPIHPLSPSPYPLILIPTGGSSGKIRFVMHTWKTLLASVEGFLQYFGVDRVHSYCVLPLYHVSGLMQFMRSFISGGTLVIQPFKAFVRGELPPIQPEDYFLSLVPTQLQRLLSPTHPISPTHPTTPPPLSRFHTILLGGAPAWSDLLEAARKQHLRLAPTYGMTETASQIATLKPEDFLAGRTGCGNGLPHAQIAICGLDGEKLAADQVGIIRIRAESLALGYYPQPFDQAEFEPDDLGYFDRAGQLHIVGRRSDKIVTGGENVFPVEVEAAIRDTDLVQDVCVLGVDDRHWGQAIVALYVPEREKVSQVELQTAIATRLSRYKHPKYWIVLDELPRNRQGKLNREQLEAIVRRELQTRNAAIP
jgi:O-succinylbenzoic acid--CoA ligase